MKACLKFVLVIWAWMPQPLRADGDRDQWFPNAVQVIYPVTFHPAGGIYFDEQRIDIYYEAKPATAVVIRYTLDGREPVESDPIVTTWIPISSNTLLTAKAWVTEIWDSPIIEGQVIPVLPTTFEVGRARYWIHEGELELRVEQPALGEIRLTW